uniref:uncharacterized protein n=1 Tax=Myxine glutinosa TaxID=7769 RepID=UPI00358E2186
MAEVYAQFCEQQAGAVAALERLKQHKDGAEPLAAAINELRDLYKRKGAGRLAEANAVLVLPVQRITRYPLLTSSLLRATPPSHPDHDMLTRALVSLTASTEKANEARRRRDIVLKYVQAPGSISLAGISLAPLSNMSAKLGAHIYRMTGLAGEPGDNVHAEIDALCVRREAVRSLLRKVFKLRQCIRKSVMQSATATEHFVHSMDSQRTSEGGMGEVAKRSCEVMQKVENVVLPALERRLQEQLEDPLAHLLRLGAGPLRLARALTAKRAEASTVSGETREAPRAAAECLGASLGAELPRFIQTADRLMDAAMRALGAALMLFSQDVALEMSALQGGESTGARVSIQPSSISHPFSFMNKGEKEDVKTTCIVENGGLENKQKKKEGYPYLQDNLQSEMSLLLQRVMGKGEKIEEEEDYTWKEGEDVVENVTAKFHGEFVEKNNENKDIYCKHEDNGTLIVRETPVKRHGETKDAERQVKDGQESLKMHCEPEKASSVIIEKGELWEDNASGTLSCVEMSGAENCEVPFNILSPNSAHDLPLPPPPDLFSPCSSPTFPPAPPPVLFPYWLPPIASTSEFRTDNHFSVNLQSLDLHTVSKPYHDPENLQKNSCHAHLLDVQSPVPFDDRKLSHNVHKALRTCRNDSGYSSLQPARRAKRITGERVYLLDKERHWDHKKDAKPRDVQEDRKNMSDKKNGTDATGGKVMQMNNDEKRDLIKIGNAKLMVKPQNDNNSEINLRDEMERGMQGNVNGKDNLQVRLMEQQEKEGKCHSKEYEHSQEEENVIGQQQKEDYLRKDDVILNNTPTLGLVRQDKNKIMQGCEHWNTAEVKDVKREIGKNNFTKETHKKGLDIRGQRKSSIESNRGHLQELDRGHEQDLYRHSDNKGHKWMLDMERNCKQGLDMDRSQGFSPKSERQEPDMDRGRDREPVRDEGQDREPVGDRDEDQASVRDSDGDWETVRGCGPEQEPDMGCDQECKLDGGCSQEPSLEGYSSSGASLEGYSGHELTDGYSSSKPTLYRVSSSSEPMLDRVGIHEPTLDRTEGHEPTLDRAGCRKPTLDRAGCREPTLDRAGCREPTLDRAGGRKPTLDRTGGREPTLDRTGGRGPTDRTGGRGPTLDRAGTCEWILRKASNCEPSDRAVRILDRTGMRDPDSNRHMPQKRNLDRDRHVPQEQDSDRERHVPREQGPDRAGHMPRERDPDSDRHKLQEQDSDRERHVPREQGPDRARHMPRERDPDSDGHELQETVKMPERCKHLPKKLGEKGKYCERNLQDQRFSTTCSTGEIFEISKQKAIKQHGHIGTKRETGIMSEAGTLRSLRTIGRENNFVDNRALKCSTLPRNLSVDKDRKAREGHRRRAWDIFQESHIKSVASPQSVLSTNSSVSLSFDSVDARPLYRACFQFTASRSNEISLMLGQKVMLIRPGDASGNPAWWLVEQALDCQGTNSRKVKRGYVPASFLQPMES